MEPEARFGAHVREHFGLDAGARIVVGISGGLDSTVLARLLHEEGFGVLFAHVNYEMRGAESEADEVFVRALADELGVAVRVQRIQLHGKRAFQERARKARYHFFGDVAAQNGAAVVAVAHHRDDQAETVLMNLFRGTGSHGLGGMPAERSLAPASDIRLIRPLLDWPRTAILEVAQSRNWTWREDATNARSDYRRNALRNEILPLVRQHFGDGVDARIAEAAARTVRGQTEETAAAAFVRYGTPHPDGGSLSLEGLQRLGRSVRLGVYHCALAAWAADAPRTAATLHEIDRLLDAQPGRRIEWPGVVIWRERDRLRFSRPGPATEPSWDVVVGTPCKTPYGSLLVEAAECAPPDGDPFVETVDADVLSGVLTLRPWQSGDRFHPLGMDGTQRISDLLTHRKVPPSERARQLVLCRDGEIIWVVGHRLAHGVRLSPETSRCLRVSWTPAG